MSKERNMDAHMILIIVFSMSNIYSAFCGYCNCADEIETLTMKMEANLNHTLAAMNKPRDCQDVFNNGSISDGIYTIYPEGRSPLRVRCNMTTDGGGWTVIQRRQSDSDFYNTWAQYVVGFGDNNFINFWLGLEHIHTLTRQATYELRIYLKDSNGENAVAKYQVFKLGDIMSKYELYVDMYSFDPNFEDPGDSLSRHSGEKFSTKDRDNDNYIKSCATTYLGGWWYEKCHSSNLNGDWGNTGYAKGPVWYSFRGYYEPLVFTQMMIRRLVS